MTNKEQAMVDEDAAAAGGDVDVIAADVVIASIGRLVSLMMNA